MRSFTICYGMMTLALGSMAVYGIANAESLRSPYGDVRVFAANAAAESQPTIILPPAKAEADADSIDSCCSANTATSDSAASAATADSAPAAALLTPTVVAGMSATEVRALLGEPENISPDGARWSYGSSVLIFNNDDRLSGHVAFDPVQAAINKYNNMMASAMNSEPAAASSSKSTGPKILHANSSRLKSNSGYLYRPMAAGSSRKAYRYDRNQEEYSYYMNRVGPMDRIFAGKRFLPRGMTTSTERNLAQSYLNYGGARYSNSSTTQYRR